MLRVSESECLKKRRCDAGKGHLGDDEISVIERHVVEVNEDVVVAQFGNLCLLVEFEGIKSVCANDCPLLGRSRCHYC